MPALIKGKNDIYTVNEKLASEWNYERNGEITPSDIAIGSPKKVWWKCEKGHEWQATPAQ
ncbi:MAG: zinc-ribbon domain-containing protein [Aeriscardovia sp.]|nr:zinc-ribbon domain-containing protein [Aeriscardovia sp.]